MRDTGSSRSQPTRHGQPRQQGRDYMQEEIERHRPHHQAAVPAFLQMQFQTNFNAFRADWDRKPTRFPFPERGPRADREMADRIGRKA